jgi:hypothetical protein
VQQLSPLAIKAYQVVPGSRERLTELSTKATAAAKQGNYGEALTLLDPWERAIKDTLKQAVNQAGKSAPQVRTASATGTVVFTQSRLAWEAARTKVQTDFSKLQRAILQAFMGHPEEEQAVQVARKLAERLAVFDGQLSEKLDAALNATAPEQKARFHDEANRLVKHYLAALVAEPVIKDLDDNPFVPVTIHATLANTLRLLAQRI